MINGNKNIEFEEKLKKYNRNIKFFYFHYSLKNFDDFKNKKLISFAGIGNPSNFFDLLKDNRLNVVKEIEYFRENLGIDEFHFEDLNPTVNDNRTKELCNLIIKKNLKITWKIVAGTKVESIKDFETV